MHYTAALPLAGAGLYALYKLRDPKLIASGAVMCAGVGAWLIVAGGGPAPRVLSAFYPTTFKNVLESLAKIMAGLPFSNLSDVPGTPVGVLLLLAAVVGVGTLIVRRADIPASAGPVMAAAISPPLFLLVAALLGNDLFVPRSLTGMAPFAWLVIVAGLTQLPKAVFAATAVLLVIALVLANQPDERRPDYKAVARFLEGNVKPGDAIVEREIFPLGPLALTLEVELDKPLHITELTDTAAAKAAATGKAPRLFVITPGRTLPGTGTIETGGRKPIESRTYPGLTPLTVTRLRTCAVIPTEFVGFGECARSSSPSPSPSWPRHRHPPTRSPARPAPRRCTATASRPTPRRCPGRAPARSTSASPSWSAPARRR